MSKPTRFAHVVYRTRRFEQMLQWYTEVFEARFQLNNGVIAFMTYDDEHHRFAFVNLGAIAPDGPALQHPSTATVEHVAYTFGSLTDLLENYARLQAAGIVPYWAIHHGITISLYYHDPDGNQMEFQVDCLGSNELANAYMHGPNFAANPIGVEFDPDAILAALRGGTPETAFSARPGGPQSPIRTALNPR